MCLVWLEAGFKKFISHRSYRGAGDSYADGRTGSSSHASYTPDSHHQTAFRIRRHLHSSVNSPRPSAEGVSTDRTTSRRPNRSTCPDGQRRSLRTDRGIDRENIEPFVLDEAAVSTRLKRGEERVGQLYASPPLQREGAASTSCDSVGCF